MSKTPETFEKQLDYEFRQFSSAEAKYEDGTTVDVFTLRAEARAHLLAAHTAALEAAKREARIEGELKAYYDARFELRDNDGDKMTEQYLTNRIKERGGDVLPAQPRN